MSVEKLLALGVQLDPLSLTSSGCLQAVEVLQEELLDVVPQLGGEGDGAVLVFDKLRDEGDRHGLALAVCGPP
ncbi:hypothetical protein [Ferrithrix thermotolerans]|uniref:hypothetical protein n=1 Tax=Ferrithrix thermotolerans TaxID=209649 RepID=UPI0015BE6806|nr:hypothetical protein [Ferrithrix thermotolerans]